jgi:hypothetical protein
MECKLAGETEVLAENLPQRHFCPSQNPTCLDPYLNPGRRCGNPTTNRLSYGAALHVHIRNALWLKHYAASRKVAGSSPDEVDFFKLT